jgi:hypothetical protein
MAPRKRASSRSRLLNRAVKAGRLYLRQAERRLPPDVRKQIDKGIKDGQKTLEGAVKQLRTRLDRTASQVDLEKALKRLDALTKQVQNIARSATAPPAATTTRRPAQDAGPQPAPSSRRRQSSRPRWRSPTRRRASRRGKRRTEDRYSSQQHGSGAEPVPRVSGHCERVVLIYLDVGQHPGIERALDLLLEARISPRRGVSPERRQLADAIDPVLDRRANPRPRVGIGHDR